MKQNHLLGFKDIHIQPKNVNPNAPNAMYPDYTITYRTANFVFEEGLVDGRLVALHYNAAGFTSAANDMPPLQCMDIGKIAQPESFTVEVDGQSLTSHWNWGGFEKHETEKGIVSTITLHHQVRDITVYVHTLVDGTPIMQRWVDVENTSDKSAALSDFAPLSGGVFAPLNNGLAVPKDYRIRHGEKAMFKLGYFTSSFWGQEGTFEWVDLPSAVYTVLGRYRRNRHRHPMFVLNNQADGEYFICQLAWSAGYAFEFDLCHEEMESPYTTLTWKLGLESPKPMRIIAPGETFCGPKIHLGAVFGGLDEAVNAMHSHIRKTVMWPNALGKSSAWVQGSVGGEYNMSREATMASMETAASLGCELYFIDAGWSDCNWDYNEERYPNGLSEMVDYAHSLGMKFGLWMGNEGIGTLSRIYKRIQEEKLDWIGKNYDGKLSGEGGGYYLDCSKQEVVDWIEEQVTHVIGDYKLDFFRLDNGGNSELYTYNERDGYLENTYIRYYENLYKMYENLRKKFPDVIFENCAGGGARTDLGLVDKFSHTWVTDWQHAPDSFRITNGMTMALPPERINRLLACQSGFHEGDITFQMRNLMFSQMLIGGFTPNWIRMNSNQAKYIRHHVEIYKNFVRPMIDDSYIYHHTPVLDTKCDKFGILEMASADGKKSMIGIFQFCAPSNEAVTVYPRGIDTSLTYNVTFDNTRAVAQVSGYELVNNGLRVRLEGALTSELILIEAV